MSGDRVEVHRSSETTEWPEKVKRGFQHFVESAEHQPFSVICAVGLNHENERLSVTFSPNSSANPHLGEMCLEISEMFQLLAKRFTQ